MYFIDYSTLPDDITASLEGLLKSPEETITESNHKFESFKEYIVQVLDGLEENVHKVNKQLIDLLSEVNNQNKNTAHGNVIKVSNFIYKNLSKNNNPNLYVHGMEELSRLFQSKNKVMGPIYYLADTHLHNILNKVNEGLKKGFADINVLDKEFIDNYKKSSFKPLISPSADFYKKVDKLYDNPDLITLIENDDYLGGKRPVSIFVANKNKMIHTFWSTLIQVNYNVKVLPEMKTMNKKELIHFIKLLIQTSDNLEKNIKENKTLINKITGYRTEVLAVQKKLIEYNPSHEKEHKNVSDCKRLLNNFHSHPFSYYFPLQQLRRQGLESIKAGLEFGILCFTNLK